MSTVTFAHVGIACTDPLATEVWYVKHLGFRRVRRVEIEGKTLLFLASADGGFRLELFQATARHPFPPPGGDGPQWPALKHLAFAVPDLDAFLRKLGPAAVVTQGPVDLNRYLEGWKAVWLADPDGHIVEVSQGYRDESA